MVCIFMSVLGWEEDQAGPTDQSRPIFFSLPSLYMFEGYVHCVQLRSRYPNLLESTRARRNFKTSIKVPNVQ